MMKEGEKLESGVRTGRLREITRNVKLTPHRESLLREYRLEAATTRLKT